MEALVYLQNNPWLLGLIVLWDLSWKGVALWKASKLSHKWWFIAILALNTVGVIPMIYIFFVARNWTTETKQID